MLWVVSLQVSAHNFYAKFIKITIMKSLIKLFTNTFILISSITASFAQIEDHYHSFSGNIYVPIIVAHQSTMKFNDGRKTENNIPDKKTTISLYMNGENMVVSKGLFSGTIIKTNSVEDEVITYIGQVSEDKKMLEYIEITKDYTICLLDTRETIEKTISLAVRFENIPSYFGGYKYKFGVSKITSVSYTEDYSVPYYGHIESYSEKFIAVDTTLISKYYSGINVNFKPGVLKLELKEDVKIAVINQSKEIEGQRSDNVMIGLCAIIINDLSKVPGISVLERLKISKIEDEIELSKSGLVDKNTVVKDGRMLMPDIEIIVTQENRLPANYELPFESFTIRSKIRIVKTGQIIDPNLVYFVDLNVKYNLTFEEYAKKVTALALGFAYQ
jgi:hypothetical protein